MPKIIKEEQMNKLIKKISSLVLSGAIVLSSMAFLLPITEKDVKAEYDGSTLLAEEAVYLNSKNLIEISNNVEITDFRGTLIAEKLVLDIEENKLNITSSRNKKVEANFNYK